ncbi:EF-P lysine aminoacylase GenX [Acinetobacter sp. RIT698]|jgi:lysyl-tRNA synthetase class 2|uniref:EF-P lysine aminoacylase EpmA n=1 Tax=Acinetobacter TaxID=469 RepID=UPI0002D10795|nr:MULTISPECIES: EF-P lysine aminoacylase EpmA [Acinetobacter]ENU60729.1 EF-P lysine aminoacylase GenX [Acinetobacter guillouiae CIP 63.46]EPH32816.1 Translation elongation factor P Lys34:lysine transferase [Acinetobacter guillouiae MSP4-18]KAB0630532.1 EF-P lysine aminoacylase GenX [Acinetobacter guillouiae]MCS4297754.1 lysyl-tRNA synthetase class 2 [Acinetobacter guillouiae]MCW2251358.1 lysyl-tRNA synthetase class 2 [Acinetobacter sp. BIGb0204]
MSIDFKPTCDIQALKARAKLYRQIRQFFIERDVLEVETPILSQAGVTDVHLASVQAQRHVHGKKQTHYLQTSPEFAMKRLLASGSGAIYQICKVFRDDEHGRKHNSEFTMLEWYRPQFSLKDLMLEVTDLLNVVLAERFGEVRPTVLSYKHAFIDRLDLNPLQATLQQLKDAAHRVGLNLDLGDDRLAYIDLLFSHMVEPSLGFDTPVFLTDFPPELASLAKTKLDEDGELVAARFELYIEGLELANAYDELIDAEVLRSRFQADNTEREKLGLHVMPIDEYLLAALPNMSDCAGIALGIDRLLMVVMNQMKLERVITFPADVS